MLMLVFNALSLVETAMGLIQMTASLVFRASPFNLITRAPVLPLSSSIFLLSLVRPVPQIA